MCNALLALFAASLVNVDSNHRLSQVYRRVFSTQRNTTARFDMMLLQTLRKIIDLILKAKVTYKNCSQISKLS